MRYNDCLTSESKLLHRVGERPDVSTIREPHGWDDWQAYIYTTNRPWGCEHQVLRGVMVQARGSRQPKTVWY